VRHSELIELIGGISRKDAHPDVPPARGARSHPPPRVVDASARRAKLEFPPIDRESAYDIIDVLKTVAGRHEVGPARVALAWVLAQPGVTSAIIGARRPEQFADNLAAVDLTLTEQDLAELDAVRALTASYLGWMHSYRTEQRFPQEQAL